MEITWLGHSCFRIRGKQTTIITDPFSPGVGYSLGKASANIVTVSHDHSDHSYSAGIGGDPRVIKRPGEYEIAGVLIIGMSTFHDANKGADRGKNTVYVLEMEEMTICHLGDLGQPLTDSQIEEIGKVDVLMVPVGGITTINATTAAAMVRQMEPRVILPMHYKTPVFQGELEPVENFLREFGMQQATPQPKLNVNKNNLPVTTQVILLEYPTGK
ncbi:MAG: lactamase [Dehalococcoidia bacterium]|nr:MAG: lactamase [Dehalococcoidia bacterium]